jgi:hypothetical protein
MSDVARLKMWIYFWRSTASIAEAKPVYSFFFRAPSFSRMKLRIDRRWFLEQLLLPLNQVGNVAMRSLQWRLYEF